MLRDESEPDQADSPAAVDLVWWRIPALSTEVPRRHGVGWAASNGSRNGTQLIESEHLRLSRQQVETRLLAHLADDHSDLEHDDPDQPDPALRLQPVHERWEDVDPRVRLLADGHRVVRLDLADHFGHDVLAGLAVEIRGRGIAARVAVGTLLDQDQTRASLAWAENQLASFTDELDETQLLAMGWSNPAPSRWQRLQRTG